MSAVPSVRRPRPLRHQYPQTVWNCRGCRQGGDAIAQRRDDALAFARTSKYGLTWIGTTRTSALVGLRAKDEKAGASDPRNDPRDFAATLTKMHRTAIERAHWDQNEAKQNFPRIPRLDGRFATTTTKR